ncbi:MAG TPA: HEAT repeat domain-containing protein [Anaerovoracaceae bacterium]|nr:HEAT repeat domain-containing protein [Anaerovoracaceae bacterium]
MTFDPYQSHEKIDIKSIVDDLMSPHLSVRHEANIKLTAIGKSAIPHLLPLLKFSPSKDTRKEVVKILGKINDPESIESLVSVLNDDNFEVRWDAAESLIHIGSASLSPLLKYLEKHFQYISVRRGARHILRALRGNDNLDDPLEKLFHALDGSGPIEQIPWLAKESYDHLQKK